MLSYRTSCQVFLATTCKLQRQKLTEFGLLKLGFGNSNLSFIYLSPTFKAIVISPPQALKLIFETMLKSSFHLANFSSVHGPEAEVHPATALWTDGIFSPSSLTAMGSNARGLASYYYHTESTCATNEIFLTLLISNGSQLLKLSKQWEK